MASAIMHLCIAKKVNEKLKRDQNMIYLGAIAPDLSKQIGQSRDTTHFGNPTNLELFTEKYPDFINNDFELGYFIHLFSDVIWQNEYFDKVIYMNNIKFLNGIKTEVNKEDIPYLVYNDYTNLNKQLIDHYELPLDLFYDYVEIPRTSIEEIDVDKLQILVDKMGVILTESTKEKNYIFDIKDVIDYIEAATLKILRRLDCREVDLHIHSNNSDGSESVKDILKYCDAKKLDYISITDHDTVKQYKDVNKYRGLYAGKIIPGCEISTTWSGAIIEILAYGFDVKKMKKELKKIVLPTKKRDRLTRKLINETFSKKGIKFDKKSKSVKMQNILNEIIQYPENDHFFNDINCKSNFLHFFREEFCDKTSQFFVDVSSVHPSIEKVLTSVKKAGGYSFLAHPYQYDSTITNELLERVVELGFDGVECLHTVHTVEERLSLIKFCMKNNLFISGGSDYHGTRKENHEIASADVYLKYINFIDKIEKFM